MKNKFFNNIAKIFTCCCLTSVFLNLGLKADAVSDKNYERYNFKKCCHSEHNAFGKFNKCKKEPAIKIDDLETFMSVINAKEEVRVLFCDNAFYGSLIEEKGYYSKLRFKYDVIINVEDFIGDLDFINEMPLPFGVKYVKGKIASYFPIHR